MADGVVETREVVYRVRGLEAITRANQIISRGGDAAMRAVQRMGRGAEDMRRRWAAIGLAAERAGRQIATAMGRQGVAAMRAMGREAANLVRGLVAVGAAGAALAAVSGINIAGQREGQFLGLKALLGGDGKRAVAVLKEIRRVSEMPGVTFDPAVSLVQSLVSVEYSAESATRAVEQFGNAIALAGRGEENLERVGIALQQILAAGTLQGDELRQLADAVPQVRGVLVDAFGTADTEAIRATGIAAKDLIDIIVGGLAELPRAGNTFSNALVNLKAQVIDVLAAFGSAFTTPEGKSAIDDLGQSIGGLVPLARALGEVAARSLPILADWLRTLAQPETINRMVQGVHALAGGLRQIGPAAASTRQMLSEMWGVLATAPGAIFEGLKADLGEFVAYWGQRWTQAKEIAKAFGVGLAQAGAAIVAVFTAIPRGIGKAIHASLEALAPLLDVLKELKRGNIIGAAQAVPGAMAKVATGLAKANAAASVYHELSDAVSGVGKAFGSIDDQMRAAAAAHEPVISATNHTAQAYARLQAQWQSAAAGQRQRIAAMRAEVESMARAATAAGDYAGAAKLMAAATDAGTAATQRSNEALAEQVKRLQEAALAAARLRDAQLMPQVAAAGSASLSRSDRIGREAQTAVQPGLRDFILRAWRESVAEASRVEQASGQRLSPEQRELERRRRFQGKLGDFESSDVAARQRRVQSLEAQIEAAKRLKLSDEAVAGLERQLTDQRDLIAAEEEYARRTLDGIGARMQLNDEVKAAELERLTAVRDALAEIGKAWQEFFGKSLGEQGRLYQQQLQGMYALENEALFLRRLAKQNPAAAAGYDGMAADRERRAAQAREGLVTARGKAPMVTPELPGGYRYIGPDQPAHLLPGVMDALTQAIKQSEENATSERRDPRSISVLMRGASGGAERESRQDRLTASVLGNLGASDDAILADARMRQDREVVRGAVIEAGRGIAVVVAQELRELPAVVARAVRGAAARNVEAAV